MSKLAQAQIVRNAVNKFVNNGGQIIMCPAAPASAKSPRPERAVTKVIGLA